MITVVATIDEVPAEVRDFLNVPVYVATREQMKCLDPERDKVAELLEGIPSIRGRFGKFAAVHGEPPYEDPLEGTIVVSHECGWYWQRLYDGIATPEMFGANGTYDADAIEAAMTVCDAVRFGPFEYDCQRSVTVTDTNISLFGVGRGVSRIKMNGVTGGFEFEDTTTSQKSCYQLNARDLTFSTNRQGFVGIRGKWMARPFSFVTTNCIENIEFVTEDIDAAQWWADGVWLSSTQNSTLNNISVQSNRYGVWQGYGVRVDGFSLVTRSIGLRVLYQGGGFRVDPLPIVIIDFGSQTTNIQYGDIITSSSGAVGLCISKLVDLGSTGTLAIAPYNEIGWSVGQTVTTPTGGNGTITSVDLTRTWGSEGYYIQDVEIVGGSHGVDFRGTSAIAKVFAGVALRGIHANVTYAPVNLQYVSQFGLDNEVPLYGLANDFIGVRIVNCEKGRVRARIENPSGYSGARGIVISGPSNDITYECDFGGAFFIKEGVDPLATNIRRAACFENPLTGGLTDTLRLKQMSSDPALAAGGMYYNTTTGSPKKSNGLAWYPF